MFKHYSIKPHSLTTIVGGRFVPHNLIRFDPETRKFFHCETNEEIIVSQYYIDENYAGLFILTRTVSLVDGTIVDSSQIHCDPETGACVDRTTNQPVQLQPNQVHFVVIDHQNLHGIDSILKLIQTEMRTHQEKQVRTKKFINISGMDHFTVLNMKAIKLSHLILMS